ncbi:MAG: hypothetical protein PGN13_13950 [Patulibacter minatonensis]
MADAAATPRGDLRRRRRSALLLLSVLLVGGVPPAAAAESLVPGSFAFAAAPQRCIGGAAFARARDVAVGRPGTVAFAVLERGRLQSFRGAVPLRSASLVKAMLLAADLRSHAAARAPLTATDRIRLRRMITVSSNRAATQTFGAVGGAAALGRLARAAGMRHFSVGGHWSSARLTAADQARFWRRLETLVPPAHRAFARGLLHGIVRDQTWGGARVARVAGFTTLFKSGWVKLDGGWIVHQGLRLERGPCTAGIAVLTARQPTMSDGVTTIRRIVTELVG